MKILFVSMPSIHFYRWIENLEKADLEFYWFDILNKGEISQFNFQGVQFLDWKKRKLKPIKGEYFLAKKLPDLYEIVNPYLEVTPSEALEKIIEEIKPDIVHSFEMQNCSYPILKSMNKFKNIKWIYSCWGSDLYYYQQFKNHRIKIIKVLERVDFLITDCVRDYEIARKLGFKNKFLGVIPGGAGFKIDELKNFKIPLSDRKIILIKGYEHNFGRALNVIKAIELLELTNEKYEIVIFGAHNSVVSYVKQNGVDCKVFTRHELKHNEVLALMGKSLIYIGNSISDGIANTLLEAIVMGAFPIQSNPGGATAEIIENFKNGLLIDDPNNIQQIADLVRRALKDIRMLENAFEINCKISKEILDYNVNNIKSKSIYNEVFLS